MLWTKEHRAFAVEEFIQNGGSPITTQRAFRIRFGIRRRDPIPDKKTIKNWVSNFRATGSALKRKSTGRPRTATGPENVAAVRALIEQSPQLSARKKAAALQLSDRSFRRILHRDRHIYKMMRSAQFQVGGPEKITVGQMNIPSIKNDEVLIKVFASAINRADTLQVSRLMIM